MLFAVLRAASIALVLLATAALARAGERDRLNACKELVDRAGRSGGRKRLPPPRRTTQSFSSAGRSSRNGRCGIRA
jgi:hypothetical protein